MSMSVNVVCTSRSDDSTVACYSADMPCSRRGWMPVLGTTVPSMGNIILNNEEVVEVLKYFPKEEWEDMFPLKSALVYFEVSWG